MQNTFEIIKDVIKRRFDILDENITMDSTFASLDIDSLDTFDIIFEIEEKLQIKIPNDEIKIGSVGDVVALIDKLKTNS